MANTHNESTDEVATPSTVVCEDLYLDLAQQPRTKGDFATLTPDNRPAKMAFSNVASKCAAITDDIVPFWRHLMYVDEKPCLLSYECDTSEDETSAEPDEPQQPVWIWTGHYRFNLEPAMLPDQFSQFGWVVGGGRRRMPNNGVAIMLTTDKKGDDVRGRHARFAFSSESLTLMLVVDKDKCVWMNGEPITGESRVITAPLTRLQFGEKLAYRLEYTGLSLNRYHDQLNELQKLKMIRANLHTALQATPTEEQIEYMGYIIHPAVDYGTFGVISACVRKSGGQLFAAKRVGLKKSSRDMVEQEVRMMKAVGHHRNTCTLVEVLGDMSTSVDTSYREIYIIHTPLATNGNFEMLRLSRHGNDIRLLALSEAVRGLAHIHRRGWMHRDIKPTNILWSEGDSRAVIADYGQGTNETESRDHHMGTVEYMAPEVLDIKEEEEAVKLQKRDDTANESDAGRKVRRAPYGQKCDVYSLGIVAFELFCKERNAIRNPYLSRGQTHVLRHERLSRCPLPVAPFLKRMLSLEVSDRPTMQEVESWAVWTHPTK